MVLGLVLIRVISIGKFSELNESIYRTNDNYVSSLGYLSDFRGSMLKWRLHLMREVAFPKDPRSVAVARATRATALENIHRTEAAYLPTISSPEERGCFWQRQTAYRVRRTAEYRSKQLHRQSAGGVSYEQMFFASFLQKTRPC